MVRVARENETEDRKRRELIDARNTADSLAYQTERTLRDLGERISAQDRQNIEEKIRELRETLKGEDIQPIRQQSEDLQIAFHAISQQMYAHQQQQGQGNGNGNGHGPQGPDEGEVVEGEFREA